MRNLLLEELKRAVQLMEENPELAPEKKEVLKAHWDNDREYTVTSIDRNFTELVAMLRAVRKHSVAYEKQKREEGRKY